MVGAQLLQSALEHLISTKGQYMHSTITKSSNRRNDVTTTMAGEKSPSKSRVRCVFKENRQILNPRGLRIIEFFSFVMLVHSSRTSVPSFIIIVRKFLKKFLV